MKDLELSEDFCTDSVIELPHFYYSMGLACFLHSLDAGYQPFYGAGIAAVQLYPSIVAALVDK